MATDHRSEVARRYLQVGSFAARAVSLALAGALVAGCAGGEAPAAPADDPVLVDGQAIYTSNCASCHGTSGEGGRGTRLDGGRVVDAYPDLAEQIDLVANGRNSMPAFAEKFTEAELEAVVRYTREVLAAS